MYFDEPVGFRFLDPDAPRKPWRANRERIEYGINDVASVDEVHWELVTGWGSALGIGAAGGLALGGWGALLGAVAGSLRFDYEIEIVFRNGNRVVAQVSGDGWDRISCALRESRREARRRAIESTRSPTPPGHPASMPSVDFMHSHPVAAMVTRN